MKIVFMGTPRFAWTALQGLLDDGQEILAVFTQPDKPRSRGMKTSPSPVKELAQAHNIPVYQPVNYKNGEATRILRDLAPDLLVVVAYGRILPPDFLSVAPMGSINVHASLLPRYRGAAPIQWAILNGDRVTGVSIQYMAAEMDTGDIISQRETEIGEYETSGELFDRLMVLGADLLVETVHSMETGTVGRIPQEEDRATYTSMLDKSLCPIDWTRTPREIVKHICGLDPWPVATTTLDGSVLRVFGAKYTGHTTEKAPGTVVRADKAGIEVACGNGETLLITQVQPAGKKRMDAGAYLLGHPVTVYG